MRLKLRAFPSSLFSRMALILLAGLLVAQMSSFWLHSGERATVVAQARGQNLTERIAEVVRVLEADDTSHRKATLAALQSSDMRVSFIAPDQVSPNMPRGPLVNAIENHLGGPREMRAAGGRGQGMGMGEGMGQGMGPGAGVGGRANPRNLPPRSIDVQLNDGQWVRITSIRNNEAPALSGDLYLQLLLTLLIIIAVVMIAVRQATKPLQQLAQAADTLGRDLDAPPLAESGPTETRRAAQAFNRMQSRIKRLVDERARALAAVSHDLRTPLTRLRLRTELVDDDKLRDQMAADLDSMATMINATLDYLRGLQDSEAPRLIDINALLQSLCEDAAVLGREVRLEGQAQAPYRGRLSALRRALQNLIDNAIKYANGARLRIEDADDELRLVVEDDGPGIAPAELCRVSEPYYRPDASRSRETGGIGLGLSIVKDIALLHGGELRLANRTQGGLQATLALPRGSEKQAAAQVAQAT